MGRRTVHTYYTYGIRQNIADEKGRMEEEAYELDQERAQREVVKVSMVVYCCVHSFTSY